MPLGQAAGTGSGGLKVVVPSPDHTDAQGLPARVVCSWGNKYQGDVLRSACRQACAALSPCEFGLPFAYHPWALCLRLSEDHVRGAPQEAT